MNPEIISQIKSEIEKAKHILLHCHPSPDPDSVGSTLAMKLALEQMGKKVTLIKGDSEISKSFAFPGVETITQKNYFEVDLKEFDLFIILDSGSVSMISSKSPVTFPDHLMTIVIDHHASNPSYGKINLVDSSYPATSQILYDLFKAWGVKIDHDIALNLFIGIYTDTGGFRYGNSGSASLKVASELSVIAPDYRETISIMENSNRKESLIFESLALSSLKTYYDGKLALVYVSYNDIVKNSFIEDDMSTGYISNKLKSVLGVEIAVTIIEREPNKIKLSFRSKDPVNYDVTKIASTIASNGGGHKMAAGARLDTSLNDAIEKVVNTVKEIYNV